MTFRPLIFICLLTSAVICGVTLTPNVAFSRFLSGSGRGPTAPASILSITASPPTGTITAIGAAETFTVKFPIAVTVTGGSPTLPIATATASSAATYCSGSGTPNLVFCYTLIANAAANPVSTTSAGIVAGGATFTDANGNTPNLSGAISVPFPGLVFNPGGSSGPSITGITSSCSGTVSTTRTNCVYKVSLSVAGYIGGSWHPMLNLGTAPVPSVAYLCDDTDGPRGALPTYAQRCGGLGSGNGTTQLNFVHTVFGGQSASPVATTSAAYNLNGSTLQTLSGTNFNLGGANSVAISGLIYAPGTAYCVAQSGGNDSSSGLCGSASFATLTKCQSAMQGGSNKTCFLQTGTYTGLGTSGWTTNTGQGRTAYITLSSSDNGEVWAAYPGQTVTVDGGSTANGNGVGVFFYGQSVSHVTIQGFANIQHFGAGGANYIHSPTDVIVEQNNIHTLYNQASNGSGSGGCTYALDFWTSYVVRHNACQTTNGFGITTNSGQNTIPPTTNGFSMQKTYDNNVVGGNTSTLRVCQVDGDCGGVYGGWYPNGNTQSLGTKLSYLTDNLINGVNLTGNAQGTPIYLDDYDSGEFIAGNILTGLYTYGVQIHNGSNNIVQNNVIDLTAVSPFGPDNDTAFYNDTSNACSQGIQCGVGQNNTITKNILYNGYSGGPPQFIGLYYDTSLLQPPALSSNWGWTIAGSYGSYCFAGTTFGGGSSGVCDTSAVTLGSQPFVNPSAQTAAGFQLLSGSTPLTGGFGQISQGQGPQWQ